MNNVFYLSFAPYPNTSGHSDQNTHRLAAGKLLR